MVSYNLDGFRYIISQQPKSEVLLMIRPSKNLRLLKSRAEHLSTEVDWKACLAKTWVTPEGQVLPDRTVLEHCQIVYALEALQRCRGM